MRNIFDQYSQPENRVTHALLTALNEDRRLLDGFLRELVGVKPPTAARALSVLEQQSPGEEEPNEEDLERRGIPDAWIFDVDDWCIVIESKVIAPLSGEQLQRHRRTAERRGFTDITLVAITPRKETRRPANIVLLEWRTIYGWLSRNARQSEWAARAAAYLEVAEAKLIDNEQLNDGTLTMFAGIPFGDDNPFTYREGKRILGLALGELRKRRDLQGQLGMNPSVPGRPAITGRREGVVWDFLSLTSGDTDYKFTNHPHLTLGILPDRTEAMVTIPHAANTESRNSIRALGESGFRSLISEIVANFEPVLKKYPGTTPWFRGLQRRYPSQRAQPFVDAVIEFDLRTAIDGADGPKLQPRWLEAAYGAFASKKNTNYQIQVGAVFPYDRCEVLRKPEAIDMIAAAWLACKSLVDVARGA